MATMPALAADEFGPVNIGKIYGVIFTACGFAGFCGPFAFAKVKELTDEEIDEVYSEYRTKGYKTLARAYLRKAQEK